MGSENMKYQASDSYILRTVADSNVLISVGSNIANFNGYIELNASAACLWKALKEPVSAEELASVLMATFNLTHEEAMADVAEYLQELLQHNMVHTV